VPRIQLPAPILLAWLVLTVVLMGQGLRLAKDRQGSLEPQRPEFLVEGGQTEIPKGDVPLLYLADRPGQLALYQVLPERRLLRWIEDAGTRGGPLLVPTTGLEPGEYEITDAPSRAGAASQEMDRPDETLPVRARFTVLPD